MRWLALALAVLVLPTGPAARASDDQQPRRFAASLRAGGFDEQGSDTMLRKDGAPGNPIVGWKGSEQIAIALGFDVRPGVTLDLSLTGLEFDFGSDLVSTGPGSAVVSTQIATGELDELRLAVWFDAQLWADSTTYYFSPERESRGRVALALVGAFTTVADVTEAEPGFQLLGIEKIETGDQSSAGLGVRMDYRLGRSRFTIGADLEWMWRLNGDLFTVVTTPGSPYSGTTVEHEGLTFLLDLSYHF